MFYRDLAPTDAHLATVHRQYSYDSDPTSKFVDDFGRQIIHHASWQYDEQGTENLDISWRRTLHLPNSYHDSNTFDALARHKELASIAELGDLGMRTVLGHVGITTEVITPGIRSYDEAIFMAYPSAADFIQKAHQSITTLPNYHPAVTFKVFDGEEYPKEFFLERYAKDREVLVANRGWHGRHDIIAHGVAWLALPDRLAARAQDYALSVYNQKDGEDRMRAVEQFGSRVDFGIFRPAFVGMLREGQDGYTYTTNYGKDLAKFVNQGDGSKSHELSREIQEHVRSMNPEQ